VYREAIDSMCQELFTPQVPILCKTANNKRNQGVLRECWTLNPAATRLGHSKQLQFLGQLIGLALRTTATIPLQLHPIIWKNLTGEELTRMDLASLDDSLVRAMEQLIEYAQDENTDEETFSCTFFETWTTHTSGSTKEEPHVIDLKPNGGVTPLTLAGVTEWAELVQEKRLHESDAQIALVKQGLATVVPVDLLSLWTGRELEHEVCGSAHIDLDVLKAHTIYEGFDESSDPVKFMWEALESFSDEDRGDFLHFVWGRSRLPATESAWGAAGKGQRFKVSRASLTEQDLPKTHTCFFQIELPPYTSVENATEKILYAVRNCRGFAFG